MLVVTRLRHGLGLLATLLCGLGAVGLVVTGPVTDVVPAALRGAGVLALVAALGAVPLVRVDERGVLVRNPWRTWSIGWQGLDEAGFGWALWVRPRGSTRGVRALAAPGPARMRSLYERHATPGGVLERDAVRTAGTAPALLAVQQGRERWARGPAASAEVRSGWTWPGLVLTAGGVVALLAGVLLGR